MSGDVTSHSFGKELHELAEKEKCLRDMSKTEAKRFDDLWSGSQNKIMGLDGKVKYTRGLGYDDSACFEGSLGEYPLYQAEDSCFMAIIEKVYEGGAYQLIDHEGERPMPPINGRYLKKTTHSPDRGQSSSIYYK
jgi:hypothetical protein